MSPEPTECATKAKTLLVNPNPTPEPFIHTLGPRSVLSDKKKGERKVSLHNDWLI